MEIQSNLWAWDFYFLFNNKTADEALIDLII